MVTFFTVPWLTTDVEHANLLRNNLQCLRCFATNTAGNFISLYKFPQCLVQTHTQSLTNLLHASFFLSLALQPTFGPWPTSMKLSVSISCILVSATTVDWRINFGYVHIPCLPELFHSLPCYRFCWYWTYRVVAVITVGWFKWFCSRQGSTKYTCFSALCAM
jgi:hypothetical protein